MDLEKAKKVGYLTEPTSNLESLLIGQFFVIPHVQRYSIDKTTDRIQNISTKKFTKKKINSKYFTVTRIK